MLANNSLTPEQVVVEGGVTEEQVHDPVRIAATIHGAAIALQVSEVA